jgi:hypothetical protein
MNIVSMIMSMLTPALISRIAAGLGADNTLVGKAVTAALPAILAGLIGKAGTPDGLKSLTGALAQQDSGLLGNLGNILGGPQQAGLATSGGNLLGSLLGGGPAGALAGAIGKFSGLGEGPAKGLLGVLGPVVLGSVAQQQKTNNLDAAGLASMLMGQKSNIQAAMPQGFADLLGGSGLLDGLNAPSTGAVTGAVTGAMKSAAGAATSAASSATAAAGSVVKDATSTVRSAQGAATGAVRDASAMATKASAGPNWLPWLIGLAALALLGWYLFGGASVPTPPAMPAMPKIMAGNVDLGAQVTGLGDVLKTTLGSVKDKASADAALPKLQEVAATVSALGATAGTLAPEGKKGLASLIGPLLPILQPMVTKALGIPDAGGLKGPLDAIMGGLTALSKG